MPVPRPAAGKKIGTKFNLTCKVKDPNEFAVIEKTARARIFFGHLASKNLQILKLSDGFLFYGENKVGKSDGDSAGWYQRKGSGWVTYDAAEGNKDYKFDVRFGLHPGDQYGHISIGMNRKCGLLNFLKVCKGVLLTEERYVVSYSCQ